MGQYIGQWGETDETSSNRYSIAVIECFILVLVMATLAYSIGYQDCMQECRKMHHEELCLYMPQSDLNNITYWTITLNNNSQQIIAPFCKNCREGYEKCYTNQEGKLFTSLNQCYAKCAIKLNSHNSRNYYLCMFVSLFA